MGILKQIENVLNNVEILEVQGDLSTKISDIQSDSRKVTAGSLFVAIPGLVTDGHTYIDIAIENGARAIVCESLPAELNSTVVYIRLKSTQNSVGQMAANFYDNPTSFLEVIGVTGTNGKTTIATLLFNLFKDLGYKCALISTIENRIGDIIKPADYTTPDSIGLQELMAEIKAANCDFVFMEVSSHAIHQNRIGGIDFQGGIFSNITHDHLDYHNTFKEYLEVKKKFFDDLGKDAFALSNADDKNGKVMLQNCKANKKFYSLRGINDYKAKVIESDLTGMLIRVNDIDFHTTLVGDFNVYNVLAVFGAARLLGVEKEKLVIAISRLRSAEGRFDLLRSEAGKIAIVDYAHTPDALENVLKTIRNINRKVRLITVIGCGGDRDKTKRPKMANISAKYSDAFILTSDNPRSEDPDQIINEMVEGLDKEQKKKMLINANREQAIKNAVMMADDKTVILVAGKGHEKYQVIRGEKIPFDDKQILKALLLEDI